MIINMAPSAPVSICSDAACIEDQAENSLKCAKYERLVYYRCAKPTAYQNCVEIPKSLLELIPVRKERSQQPQASKTTRI